MRPYRHALHAGNHADVLKHLILVQVLKHLLQEDEPWCFIDTHAGAGLYDLCPEHVHKKAAFESGIGRLWGCRELPQTVADYVEVVRGLNPDGPLRLYPGSPWIVSRLLRTQDRLRLFELHPREADLLRCRLAGLGRQVRIEAADGFAGLKAVLPPPHRGLVLCDPAYEVRTDYRQVPAALEAGLERFGRGIYVVWYPMLPRPESEELPERLKCLPVTQWLHVQLRVRAPSREGQGMHGSGLYLVNPPWPLAECLRAVLPWLVAMLGQDDQAGFALETQGV